MDEAVIKKLESAISPMSTLRAIYLLIHSGSWSSSKLKLDYINTQKQHLLEGKLILTHLGGKKSHRKAAIHSFVFPNLLTTRSIFSCRTYSSGVHVKPIAQTLRCQVTSRWQWVWREAKGPESPFRSTAIKLQAVLTLK